MTPAWTVLRARPAGDDLIGRLLAELSDLTEPPLPHGELEAILLASVRDLSGSVSAESMPEMAARLAAARIGVRPVPRQDLGPEPWGPATLVPAPRREGI